jgi:hypothetical protein
MPAEFDRCVKSLMHDPKFKPRKKGQTKESAAYAVCTRAFQKRHGKNPQDASADYISSEEYAELFRDYPELALKVIELSLDKSLEELNERFNESTNS